MPLMSLSARRAWIEIDRYHLEHKRRQVALRKESVDRNCVLDTDSNKISLSLSARRAWIEICFARNLIAEGNGRSPQGERG